MTRLVWLAAALAACSDGGDDVVGPFTGEVHRFVVDRFDVPRDSTQAAAVAADLDGDATPDNKFGNATSVLATTNDLSPHAADMIAAGVLASVVEVQADSLFDDDRVGVRYLGADGAPATVVGGRLVAGVFIPNRTRDTSHPGAAMLHLPVFVNADPLLLPVEGLEIELAPDGTGGYNAIVRGGIREVDARAAALAGLVQMFETEPERHLVFLRGIDEDRDDTVSADELASSVIGLLVADDIELRGEPAVSIAVGVHLAPCAEGTCTTQVPQMTCRDRIVDAGETDRDCGGPCQRCADGLACGGPADCQSNACDAGRCRAATCSDGVQDGYESDVDCGGGCPACATGSACAADRDCASASCDNGVTVGRCQ